MPEPRTRSPLRINPTPFKPTLLSIPPSPCSPRTPLTPKPLKTKTATSPRIATNEIYYFHNPSDAPPSPLSWVWQCHQCHRSYHLGVTRRCLEDGHQFCSGTTAVKAWRKPVQQRRTRRHRACASEFDYQGWKAWGRWRRGGARNTLLAYGATTQDATAPRKKDCWNTCDYPSECRWGKKFGIHTPTPSTTTFPVLELCSEPVSPDAGPKSPEEGVLLPENVKMTGLEQDKADFWGALLASATRRKSETQGSPLTRVEEEVYDEDGDVVMSSPSSSEESSPSTSPTKAFSSTAMDLFKDLMKRKTGRKERTALKRERVYAVDVPVLTMPEPILKLKNEGQVCLSEGDKFLEDFQPLERLKSRKDLVSLGTVGGS